MSEREVIATCIFVWADRERMTCSDAKNWKLSRKYWDDFLEKKTVLTIGLSNVPGKTPDKGKKNGKDCRRFPKKASSEENGW